MQNENACIETQERLTAEVVAKRWAIYGINDLVFQFVVLENWHEYRPFFLEQGFEKICKAYLLANKSSEYEKLSFQEAKKKVNDMAMEYSHDLEKMVEKLKEINPQFDALLRKEYDEWRTGNEFISVTGSKVVSILKRGFIESRYIVPNPISHDYPIKNTDMWCAVLLSSALDHFVFEAASAVLQYITEDFKVIFSQSNPWQDKISDSDWERFKNLFPYFKNKE